MTDDWNLNKVGSYRLNGTIKKEAIETLREKLIEDMHYFIKDLFDFSQDNLMKPIKTVEDYGEGKVKRIINKRFGVDNIDE